MNACISTDNLHNWHSTTLEKADMYVKEMLLTFEEINELISYDPTSGIFIWRKSPARHVKAGDEAGTFKNVRTKAGATVRYKYIHVLHNQTPAARVAWLLTRKEWPKGNLLFRDGDSSNLKFENLKEADFPSVRSIKSGRRTYKMTGDAMRHYGLMHNYGLSLETYNVMLAAQGGVCAICKGVETYIPKGHGTPKPLSVDHNHETGAVRGLLCSHCNYVIGYARENIETLRETIKYLEKYAAEAPMPREDIPSEMIDPSEEIH
jgi:hypothetical protein